MGGRKHNHARRRNNAHKISVFKDPRKLRKGVSAAVAGVWDKTATPTENYKALGLVAKISDRESIKKHAPAILSRDLGLQVEWEDLPDAEEIRAKLIASEANPRRAPDYCNPEEVEYLQLLVQKHGDPEVNPAAAVKMARDIKTNWMQHSGEHLTTRIARMKRYLAYREELEEERQKLKEHDERAKERASSSSSSSTAGVGNKRKRPVEDEDDDDDDEEEEDEEEEEAPKRKAAAPRATKTAKVNAKESEEVAAAPAPAAASVSERRSRSNSAVSNASVASSSVGKAKTAAASAKASAKEAAKEAALLEAIPEGGKKAKAAATNSKKK